MMPASSYTQGQDCAVVWLEDLRWTPFHGHCIGVRICLPAAASEPLEKVLLARLHPEEIRLANQMPHQRALDWIGGRIALREAMKSYPPGLEGPVFSTRRGAPLIPAGVSASISHKSNESEVTAVALVAKTDGGCIGVDLEFVDEPREAIAPLVLTPGELKIIEDLPDSQRWFRLLLHFSLKEAVYKAIDPVVQRYVDYQEASLNPRPDGSAEVIWRTGGLMGLGVDAVWTARGRYILTSARLSKLS